MNLLKALFASVALVILMALSCDDQSAPSQEAAGAIAANYTNDKGIGSHPDVLLFSNFEDTDWMESWNGWQISSPVPVNSNENEKFIPLDGKALQATVPKGQHTGLNMTYRFQDRSGSEPEEIYFRYYLRLGNGWSPTSDGKFPGIAGTYGRAGWGGRVPNGYDGWSARGLFGRASGGKTPIGNYTYHLDDKKRKWGEHLLWGGPAGPDNRAHLENNRWYCIETYVRLNTPGEYDGILRGWIDGELTYDRTNLRFRDTTDLKIETVWLNLYHGGSLVAPSDHVLFIDNVVIARSYIGPKR
jgi:hypothetical protein